MRETIEEAAENNYPDGDDWTIAQAVIRRLAFKKGAKWQQEQDKNKYSEQDIKGAYNEGAFAQLRYRDGKKWVDSNEWFSQFKKEQQ
jgi:hypothetical protein